ncbi:MAG: hypothetical protein ACE5E6_09425 [Phycisphaerae bacterium]
MPEKAKPPALMDIVLRRPARCGDHYLERGSLIARIELHNDATMPYLARALVDDLAGVKPEPDAKRDA